MDRKMKEKINVKAVSVVILFVILGIYFILLEKKILTGIWIIFAGISLNFLEVVKWVKELFSLIKSFDKGNSSQNQHYPHKSPQVKTGNNSPVIINYSHQFSDEKRENSEKIYAPLLTEFKNNLEVVKNYSRFSVNSNEWNRITQKDYITHRIKLEIKQNLENFYKETSKSYSKKYNVACRKINEIVNEEFNKRWDGGYTLENTDNLIGYLYSAFIIGRVMGNQSFLKQQLDGINSQLENKYKNFDNFFKENLKLLNQEKEIKEIRKEQNKIIKQINFIIPLLEKELK